MLGRAQVVFIRCLRVRNWGSGGLRGQVSLLSWDLVGDADFDVVDMDEKSLEFARENVRSNAMERRIKLLKTERSGPLIPLDELGFEKYISRVFDV
jgi:tRNA1(Val) A37 N6-methylase TrmN6